MQDSMVMAAPDRSLEQRRAALKLANSIRSYRAELKVKLKTGRRTATFVLTCGDPRLDTMKVLDVLVAMPKVGRVKAVRWLNKARVSPSKTVAGLSDRQRGELLTLITPRRVGS